MSRDRAPARPRTLRLRHGPLTIDVASEDSTALVWLAEFLGPAFRSRTPGRRAADHGVVFEVGPGRHAALARQAAHAPLRGLEGFTFDGSFSRHRGRRDDAGRTWVHDPAYDTFYGVDPTARGVFVVAARAGSGPRLALMRVVRELATAALLRAGRLPVHGAAFAWGGEVVLACGPRRAGKTSLLVHALTGGASFVSNDRIFVDVGRATASPMPTIVMLRDGTLSRFPDLEASFEKARFDRSRTLAECAFGKRRPAPQAGMGFDRPGISAAQLARLLGTTMRAGGRVRAILFPRIDARATGIVLRRLSPARAAAALGRSLLVPSRPLRVTTVFSPAGRAETIPARVLTEGRRRLAAAVPAFSCRLGPDAYATELRAVLRRALRPSVARPTRAPRRRSGGR